MAGSKTELPEDLLEEVKRLEQMFTVDTEMLKSITDHFVKELTKGTPRNSLPWPPRRKKCVRADWIFVVRRIERRGWQHCKRLILYSLGDETMRHLHLTLSQPMIPTWVMSYPDGHETGTFLALDMGGTNLRVCQITLTEKKSEFDILQSKYRMPEELKTASKDELWDYIADCLHQFLETHHGGVANVGNLHLGFTFSYPAVQNYIDEGILQTWTKGFDIAGVEGNDVVPMFEAALVRRVSWACPNHSRTRWMLTHVAGRAY